MAKDFFTGNAIPYEEFDVMTDVAKRQEMIEKSGQMGVPVIVIGDDEIMVGFDEKHLKAILGL
jgi:glutaredoxin